jgi:hypothetical protein
VAVVRRDQHVSVAGAKATTAGGLLLVALIALVVALIV